MIVKNVLQVKNLHTYFDSPNGIVKAVQNMSLSLTKNQVLGIIGESGSGKTTTGLSIMRLVDTPGSINKGSIYLEKENISGLSESAMRSIRGKDIAMTFENSASMFNPLESIGDQVREVINIHTELNYKDSTELTLKSLTEIGITNPNEIIEMRPPELSVGVSQKVMLAMSTILEPKVLIVDEITRNVDIMAQAQLSEQLRNKISSTDVSVILLTNDPGVLAQLADTVIVMFLGRKLEQAPVKAIYSQPMHPYTSQLLRPMETRKVKTIRVTSINESQDSDRCPLVDRCERAISKCRMSPMPPVTEINENHHVACYNPLSTVINS